MDILSTGRSTKEIGEETETLTRSVIARFVDREIIPVAK